ncbi:group II intron reverse transcriptase/maturase [Serratia marcescens]|uniref:group II intron reverse transcriptase/maturase n=1 Tax=Serratia marcescens TaxID=615 RepID=UPI0018D8415D|nr:group II intron reverse transcriptase/maturase [Serratia marcescens]
MMNGREKSDLPIVATKPTNKPKGAESVERRGGAKGNTEQSHICRTQSRISMSQRLERVRYAAKQRKKERFTALFHMLTKEALETAFFWLKKKAAVGADGVSWDDYAQNLGPNIIDLHDRLHRGSYRVQPSRRQYIPKTDGKQRPLGIASLEDKVVQRALVEILNAVYETDFMGFSYGFRPGRSQHDALDALATGLVRTNVSWVLDADISQFFDKVSHDWLIKFIEHRIGDQRVIKLIRKWLKAGTIEDGVLQTSDEGTPQGAVISPLLANIYLHYVFDLWVQQWRKRHATGNVIVVRYADDIVMGFDKKNDAQRFRIAMQRRLKEFCLTVHPRKTRLIEFGRFAAENRNKRGKGKPETFNFLGFTHICGRDRGGRFMLMRKTRRDRLKATLKEIKIGLRKRWHNPIPEQGKWLRRVVQGYLNYHSVPGNFPTMRMFRVHVVDLWRRALRRRSQKDDTTWTKANRLAAYWLPKARVLHPWPVERFTAKHPRQEPGARIAHAGICTGGAR